MPKEKTRVVIVDDELIALNRIKMLLSHFKIFQIIINQRFNLQLFFKKNFQQAFLQCHVVVWMMIFRTQK